MLPDIQLVGIRSWMPKLKLCLPFSMPLPLAKSWDYLLFEV